MRLFILLSLVCGTLAVQGPLKNNYIRGGDISDIEKYPFMSSMQVGINANYIYHFCAGVLITSQTVLTAANCYYGFSILSFQWRVRLGSEYWNNGGSIHFLSEVIMHEDFDTYTSENDVAIVRLTAPAIFSAKIGVARIAGSNYNVADGTNVDIVGWKRYYGGFFIDFSDHLYEIRDVRVINNQFCATRWLELTTTPDIYVGNVTGSMICTGVYDGPDDIRNTCVGNQGGPVLHNGDVVIGVYSWDHDCGSGNLPGVSTKVATVSDWIVANGSTRSHKISVV